MNKVLKLILFFGTLAVLFGLSLLLVNRSIEAGCASGWYCTGTTRVDYGAGCFPRKTESGTRCYTMWLRTTTSCDANCSQTYRSHECANNGGPEPCFIETKFKTTNCCAKESSPPPPPPPTPTPPPPPPSCSVDLTPDTSTYAAGTNQIFTSSVTNVQNGTVDQVDFSSSDTNIATVNPASDTSATYQTEATGQSAGTATITANVIMSGSSRCSDVSTVTITTPGPWWQVINADIITNGNLVSEIPATCSLPTCDPNFDLDGAGGYPGIPAYGGSYNFESGGISSTNWLVNSSFSTTKVFDYAFFARLIPPDVTFNEITTPSINGGTFETGGVESRGFYWYHYDGSLGDLTITSNANVGTRKVILLVEGADLYLNGRMNLTDGQGFFMAIVGKDTNGLKGDIIVDSAVSDPLQPELEGIFVADSEFRTGAGTNQLHIRGMVAAYDGVSLERDLTDDSDTPAELFEYAPDLIFNFSKDFNLQKVRWKEVAP